MNTTNPTSPRDGRVRVDGDLQTVPTAGFSGVPNAHPAPENGGAGFHSVVSYIRRSPRMNGSQQASWERNAPRYIVTGLPRATTASQFTTQPPLDLVALFGRDAPLVVEIGVGAGETLTAGATAWPECDFIGFEVYEKVLGSTMSKLAKAELNNVRLIAGDAVSGLEHLLPPESIRELWTFFPDPWQKKRHHKRRLVGPAFAELVLSRLAPGGLWRLATDWDDYATHIHEVLDGHPKLVSVPGARFAVRPMTRFEARGVAAGRTITDFTYRKVADV
ncbi:MAG: tRNA (guanosine(46)-N7)-methyltransferase TrmB [Propionibacteriaceae bacterium]|jgi:tRNA (guanine-N7-)-methyltransferase|nr:tRNA (guanosine(46)-N7)-methyltransferase TrmB [Propionibacteriaceae bacterium]